MALHLGHRQSADFDFFSGKEFNAAAMSHSLQTNGTFIEDTVEKYHLLEANMFTLIKSMTFFIDADTDDMPKMLVPLAWEEVKRFFYRRICAIREEIFGTMRYTWGT